MATPTAQAPLRLAPLPGEPESLSGMAVVPIISTFGHEPFDPEWTFELKGGRLPRIADRVNGRMVYRLANPSASPVDLQRLSKRINRDEAV
jgi:hypothetical protein